jgi:hypothetical protein
LLRVYVCASTVALVFAAEYMHDSGNPYEFTALIRDLEDAGEVTSDKSYNFEFLNVEKNYETYNGNNVRLRCVQGGGVGLDGCGWRRERAACEWLDDWPFAISLMYHFAPAPPLLQILPSRSRDAPVRFEHHESDGFRRAESAGGARGQQLHQDGSRY